MNSHSDDSSRANASAVWQDPRVDLSNCEREPVHTPGHVQPHGALLAADPNTLLIEQVSDNLEALGLFSGELYGKPLEVVLPPVAVSALQRRILDNSLDGQARYVYRWEREAEGSVDVLAHVYKDVLMVELEVGEPTFFDQLPSHEIFNSTLEAFERTTTVQALCDCAADEFRSLTGYDRVMLYRFGADDSGHVLAESSAPELELESYRDLHYPASDIPRQVRALFLEKRLRLLADNRYQPAFITPEVNPRTGKLLDMSFGVLRGSSVMYTEYLENMGVRASLTVAIVQENRLWGLVACHHYRGPRHLPFDMRTTAEFLGRALALQISHKEKLEQRQERSRMEAQLHDIETHLSPNATLLEALTDSEPGVVGLIADSTVVVVVEGAIKTFGTELPTSLLQALCGWLTQIGASDVYATDSLTAAGFPKAESIREPASGLMAMPIARSEGEWLLWLRPEQNMVVNWAGDPTKPVLSGPHGDRLMPRKSFALWEEIVRGRSQPWTPLELEMVRRLRNAVATAALQRDAQLRRLNAELARSNEDLDAFAYVASHDLKEPLRAIANYAGFLTQDYGERLDDEGRDMLEALVRLSDRLRQLIDSLLRFSRMGRAGIHITDFPLTQVIDEIREDLVELIRSKHADIQIEGTLPRIHADRALAREMLSNLISNAIKYTDRATPQVFLSYEPPGSPELPAEAGGRGCILVRDTGIGIPEEHHEDVFQIFRRLHPSNAYSGGTGAGLTIVRRIVQLHDGWVGFISHPGRGTTFFVSLAPQPEEAE